MAIRLGELLIKKNLLTQAQLEEALQAQVIFGGTLGTILIEMGLISENVLAEILANLLNIPCLKPNQLEDIPEHVINTISPELAEKYKVVPVELSGKKLTLAMESPHDLKSIDDISFRTGYIVQPILALEVRLIFALENYYGIKRTMRYIAPPKHVREELDKAPIFHTPDGPITAAETDQELSEPGSEQIYQRPDKPAPKTPEEQPAEGIEELEDVDVVEELVDEEVTLENTSEALVKISDRNDVADAIITYLGTNYARAALFMVVAGQVTGWRSAKAGVPIPGFDQLQLPLSEPSVLKTAVDSNSYFLGPVQQSGANLALTTFLGKPAPTTALLIPMSMLGRVVGLIYVDDPEIDLSQAVVDVQQLASKGLMAFEILILHNKILRT